MKLARETSVWARRTTDWYGEKATSIGFVVFGAVMFSIKTNPLSLYVYAGGRACQWFPLSGRRIFVFSR